MVRVFHSREAISAGTEGKRRKSDEVRDGLEMLALPTCSRITREVERLPSAKEYRLEMMAGRVQGRIKLNSEDSIPFEFRTCNTTRWPDPICLAAFLATSVPGFWSSCKVRQSAPLTSTIEPGSKF